ncbi:MAG: hypothetical protein WBV46_08035 [Terriglobales bacterium]|jgi:hypothetical protein
MTSSDNQIPGSQTPAEKIPAEIARELRTLAHDLSNALETIIQATYLISQSGPPESLSRWVQLIDQASQDAVKINNKLREIMRNHS